MDRYRIRIAPLLTTMLLGIVVVGGGCAELRLPAIDPSGERIFLPQPSSTTLDPELVSGSFWPTPAYTSPGPVPPCPPQPGSGIPSAMAPLPCNGGLFPGPTTAPTTPAPVPVPTRPLATSPLLAAPGYLVLSPGKMIAPVGSEVVLVSGYCGTDGAYTHKEPIEWMLDRESAGHFVQVGSSHHAHLSRWLHPHERRGKLTNNYAVSRTRHTPEVLTRGTPAVTDDVMVAKGQTWISVTSSSAGTSRVTAVAPEATNWNSRRKTAVIYWIDAQWQFPAPAVVRAGQSHLLTTRVTRTDGSVSSPWFVQYDVAGGPPVTFGPERASSIRVPTDPSGLAAVEVVPASGQPGTTQIQIQVIRPAQPDRDVPEMVVGTGWTNISWSAAALQMQLSGPGSVPKDAIATFQIDVINSGDLPASDVVVNDVLPPGLVFVDSEPAAQIYGNRVWNLGTLSAQEHQSIRVRCRAEQAGDYRYCANAKSAEGLAADDCASLRVFTSALSVELSGPAETTVGRETTFRVRVKNTGNTPLENVTVTDTLGEGLQHPEIPGETRIEKALGTIPAQQMAEFAVKLIATQPGQLCHTLFAEAEGGHTASDNACVLAREAAAPQVPATSDPDRSEGTSPRRENTGQATLTIRGPETARVGARVLYTMRATNTGTVPLTDVRLSYVYPYSVRPLQASDDWKLEPTLIYWLVELLEPGEMLERQVECIAAAADPASTHQAKLTARPDVRLSRETTTRILRANGEEAPRRSPAGLDDGQTQRDEGRDAGEADEREAAVAPPNVNGSLIVTVSESSDPARAGATISYIIEIENGRNVEDRNVTLQVDVPEPMKVERVSGPTAARDPTSSKLVFLPAAYMRPNDTLRYRVEVSAAQAGQYKIAVRVESLRSMQTVTREEVTVVRGE